jgi:short subunit dehydrogenase-like uncharacterized protein
MPCTSDASTRAATSASPPHSVAPCSRHTSPKEARRTPLGRTPAPPFWWWSKSPVAGSLANPTSTRTSQAAIGCSSRVRTICSGSPSSDRAATANTSSAWNVPSWVATLMPPMLEARASPPVACHGVAEQRGLDIVVFGATGFVGRLTAEHLAGQAPDGVRVGLAGRSAQRLAAVRDALGPAAAGWPLVVADLEDPASLRALAARARVVASTAGPYRRGGLALVEACVSAGADYADLAGEVLFMRDSAGRHHAGAAAAGVRIVHACGFDSIPSDLGVLTLHETARADAAGELEDTTLVVTGARGGVSGGTIASMRGQLEELRADPSLRRIVADPYALSPDRAAEPDPGAQPDLRGVRRDDDLGGWLGPFVMAPVNTRVVRRSNALLGWAYGRRFRYREVAGFGAGPAAPVRAAAATAGLAALAVGLGLRPTRALLARVLPAPGEGPGQSARRNGCFRMALHARTSSGARYVGHVAARGDPGYAATAVMLGQSALCLARDRDRLPARAGVLTPATAMGTVLRDRLRAAGFTFEGRRTPERR